MANETNGDRRPTNPAGVYTHRESGNKLHVTDPIQGDAAVRIGFERTGDLPKSEKREAQRVDVAAAEAAAAEKRQAEYDAAAAKAEEQALAEQNERRVAAEKAGKETEAAKSNKK